MRSDLQSEIGEMIRQHDAMVTQEATVYSPRLEMQAHGEQPGQVIGRYTLVDRLGSGGFGAVWQAEQTEPVKRQVALKIIKLGMDTHEVIARFDQERQALAVMDHPNIARVLDAGATPSGRPYFVMEMVRGTAISEYCDGRNLSTPERLNLFLEVCLAVQHAHQKGIIHRDIKPTNILVAEHEGRAQVKVIDFGIAKATGGERLTDLTIVTRANQFIGTPAYMSPEQISGATDVDTRTDIYSLGVLLYELLTGHTPFDTREFESVGQEDMLRILRDRPAPKPSTRLKTMDATLLQCIAEKHHSRPAEMLRMLRGDLDWIVMKALEKDRDRRYDTANALHADVRRFLNQEPVQARPPSTAYVVRQFARRNRVAVTGAAAVLAVLIAGLSASTYLYFRESEARNLADAEAEKSRQVSDFLKETLSSAGASKAMGRDATMMVEVLDKTAEHIGTKLANRPRVEAELRQVIGKTYEELAEYPQAIQQHTRAVELQRRLHDSDHPDLADALLSLGSAIEHQGNPKEAEPYVREALAMLQRIHGSDDPAVGSAHTLLAWILLKSGRSALGADSAKLGYDIWRTQPGDPRLESAPKTHATILKHLGRTADAEAVFREELATWRRVHGVEHPAIANCLDNFGMILVDNGKFDEAEPILLEALAQGRKFYGDRSPHEDHVLARLAIIAARRGDEESQLQFLRDGVAVACRVYSEGHRYRKEAYSHLIKALQTQAGRYSESTAPGAAEKARARLSELEELARSQDEVQVKAR